MKDWLAIQRARAGLVLRWLALPAFFIGVPALELFLLLQIGSLMGPLPTFVMLLLTGVVGAWMAKREGLQLLRQLSLELRNGLPPGVRMVEGGLVVVGGLLLITPGVLTDLAGVLLILPPTRRFIAPRLMSWVSARFLPTEEEPESDPDGVRVRRPRTVSAQPRPTPPRPASHPFANPFDDLP